MRKPNQCHGETATCYSAIDMKEKRVPQVTVLELYLPITSLNGAQICLEQVIWILNLIFNVIMQSVLVYKLLKSVEEQKEEAAMWN